MRKNNSTRTPTARPRREPDFDEPVRRWSTLPLTEDRASELVDAFTRYDDGVMIDALIQLICGLAPPPAPDELQDLDERRLAGTAALSRAFTHTRGGRITNSAHTSWNWSAESGNKSSGRAAHLRRRAVYIGSSPSTARFFGGGAVASASSFP